MQNLLWKTGRAQAHAAQDHCAHRDGIWIFLATRTRVLSEKTGEVLINKDERSLGMKGRKQRLREDQQTGRRKDGWKQLHGKDKDLAV
jgi:hypothetical protein